MKEENDTTFYVDVHTHLTHEDFEMDRSLVIERASKAGLGAIVCNGLEPRSNRIILQLAKEFSWVKPALGIYPLDAMCHHLPKEFPFEVEKFDVQAEIAFIRSKAAASEIHAIGECGLDQHYVGAESLIHQEKVFRELIDIGVEYDLPLIIHTRRAEERAAAILREHKAKKVNFHCFGGRTAWAKKWAEEDGWWFSIPANATVNQAFQKMMKILPQEKILTETDAPYLAPVRGERNEPSNVVGTIALLAQARGLTETEAKKIVFENYRRLFI